MTILVHLFEVLIVLLLLVLPIWLGLRSWNKADRAAGEPDTREIRREYRQSWKHII